MHCWARAACARVPPLKGGCLTTPPVKCETQWVYCISKDRIVCCFEPFAMLDVDLMRTLHMWSSMQSTKAPSL
jgi:hypothetical protein